MEYDLNAVHELLRDISDKFGLLSVEIKTTDISIEAFKRKNKDILAEWLFCFTHMLNRSQRVLRTTSATLDQQKNTIISFQEEKLKNQEQLLDGRNQALDSFQSTFQSEMKSYRDVVTGSSSNVSSANVEIAVKKAVQEEERSRNVMLFGVEENDDIETETAVENLFLSIGEKPRISDCSRIGNKSTSGPPRPIKVSMASAESAVQVQASGRRLRDNPDTKRVFIAPDRTREEREERRKLVEIVRARVKSDPTRYHFIQGTTVVSRDRESVQSSSAETVALAKPSHNNPQANMFDDALERAKAISAKIAGSR